MIEAVADDGVKQLVVNNESVRAVTNRFGDWNAPRVHKSA